MMLQPLMYINYLCQCAAAQRVQMEIKMFSLL